MFGNRKSQQMENLMSTRKHRSLKTEKHSSFEKKKCWTFSHENKKKSDICSWVNNDVD